MNRWLASVALGWFAAVGATAAATEESPDATIQGQQLAQQLCHLRPTENFTNSGTLIMRSRAGKRLAFPVKCQATAAADNWEISYTATQWSKNSNIWNTSQITIQVEHSDSRPNRYEQRVSSEQGVISKGPGSRAFALDQHGMPVKPGATHSSVTLAVAGQGVFAPFAGSDFWVADLGLEFFHWPAQTILRHEMRRGRSCQVLESTNPNPAPGSYTRVVSWIDHETLGIVQAEAYDAKGRLLKEFFPKSFKKVNGQWELQEMEIRNDQTWSHTWLEFDLKPPE